MSCRGSGGTRADGREAVRHVRTLMRFQIDTPAGNELIRSGQMPKLMDEMLEQLHPEAVYFFPQDGCRGGLMVFDLEDPSMMPVLTEPMWERLHARIEMSPVMNLDELRAGLTRLASG